MQKNVLEGRGEQVTSTSRHFLKLVFLPPSSNPRKALDFQLLSTASELSGVMVLAKRMSCPSVFLCQRIVQAFALLHGRDWSPRPLCLR